MAINLELLQLNSNLNLNNLFLFQNTLKMLPGVSRTGTQLSLPTTKS